MSTVRIQVRRGTSSEWTAANPILAAGEMGVETNTNKFKFGNGTDAWTVLAYAASDSQAIGEISQDAINQALAVGSGLTKTYDDGANTITVTVNTDVISTKTFATSEATTKAAAAQTAAEAYTDSAINGVNSSLSGYLETGDRGVAGGVASLNNSGKVPESELQLVGLTTSISTSGSVSADNITVAGNLVVNGTTTTLNTQNYTVADPMIYIGEDNHSNQLDLGFVASHDDGTYNHTGLVRDASVGKWKLFKGVTDEPTTTINFAQGSLDDLSLNNLDAADVTTGDLTVSGFVTLPASSIVTSSILDGAVTEAKIAVNSVDNQNIKNGAVATTKIADAAVTTAKLADNAITAAKISADSVTTVKIADDSITDAKLQSDSVTEIKIANNAVTESKIANASVTQNKIASNAVTAGKIAANTIVNADISNTAAIAQSKIDGLGTSLGLLAPKAAPTFTGTVTLPATTSIGTVSSTEIGYIDGVTSSVQTQLDAKASSATVSSHTSGTTNVHGIADTALLATTANVATAKTEAITAAGTAADTKISTAVSALTKSSVGLANVDNTSDVNKPVSTAQQTALDLKANLAGPTFTGTVVLPSTTSIGNVSATEISYVDGVTSAIQTQLDSKLGLAGGTMTGALTLSGAPTLDLHAATKLYVDNVVSGINFHQPVRVATTANITLSGTQTIDGVALSVGDRVLVKDQTTQTQNGIYVVASGAWSRATDADNNPTGELSGGDFALVLEGTVGSGYGYVCSNTSAITVGTTNITYVPFNAAKAVSAGAGLTESTPGTIDIAAGGVTSAMIADGAIVDADINASAAIAQSKISGLTSALAAKAPSDAPTFTNLVTIAASGIAFADKTQTKAGVPSLTTIASAVSANTTLDALGTDAAVRDSLVPLSGAVNVSFEATGNAKYAIGSSINFYQSSGTGANITGNAITILSTPGSTLRTTNSSVTATKIAATTWLLAGDLKA